MWLSGWTRATIGAGCVLASCGPRDLVRNLPQGTTAEVVLSTLGEPKARYTDARSWVKTLGQRVECLPSLQITRAWRYDPLLHDDAMVFFDATDRVVCVYEGGVIFDERSD
jgi:hypothetical protein